MRTPRDPGSPQAVSSANAPPQEGLEVEEVLGWRPAPEVGQEGVHSIYETENGEGLHWKLET